MLLPCFVLFAATFIAADIPKLRDAAEYYRAPVENIRTYPVYWPSREPRAYWQFIQKVGPLPIIETKWLKRDWHWIDTGKRVFEEWDVVSLRSDDVERARSEEELIKRGYKAAPDGTIPALRWVPTEEGVKLGVSNCARCHISYGDDFTPRPNLPSLRGRTIIGEGFPHRGPADLMKYAAMSSCDPREIDARLPDSALYSLVLYLYSLDARNGSPYSRR